jgi:hypothetical protein
LLQIWIWERIPIGCVHRHEVPVSTPFVMDFTFVYVPNFDVIMVLIILFARHGHMVIVGRHYVM